MTTQALLDLLGEHSITDQITETLIDRFSDSAPYLPVVSASEFAGLFDDSLTREVQNILRERSQGEALMYSLLFAIAPAENNPLLMLRKVSSSKSCDDQLFNPEDTTARGTLLTVDFLHYLMLSDTLTPYAAKQLKERLKANRFNFSVEVPSLPEPSEEEMLEALLEGLVEAVKKGPKKFQDEVTTALLKKSLSPNTSTRDSLFNLLDNVRIVPKNP